MTICDYFYGHVLRDPSAIAVHHRGQDFSYGEIAAAATDIACSLADGGLASGDRVLLMLRNSAEYVAAYLGILKAGGVVVALNPVATLDEVQGVLDDCEPVAAFLEPKRMKEFEQSPDRFGSRRHKPRMMVTVCELEALAPAGAGGCAGYLSGTELPEFGSESVAQIIYTSGTTGKPKGVTLSHRNLVENSQSIISYLGLTQDDSVLVVLPFFYSYGNSLLFTHLCAGGRLVIAADTVYWSRIVDLMADQRVTGFSGVPSTYAMLLHKSDFQRRALPALRYLTCAGGRLAPAVSEAVTGAHSQAELFLMYGQTEATARLSTVYPADLPEKAGSIGRGIPGVTLKVLGGASMTDELPPGEVGEIVASGPNIMLGYWNDPELTRTVLSPAGLRTGDLGYRDEDGFIFLSGRKDDMIKSGGHRVFPAEVEDAILGLEGVAEVAVVGVADDILYERPVAVVVAATGNGLLDESTVLVHCSNALPPHKRPARVQFVDSLPKTSSGKIQRSAVRRLLSDAEKRNIVR